MKYLTAIPIFFSKLHYSYYSDEGRITALSKSGALNTALMVLFTVLFHALVVDIYGEEWGYETWAWIFFAFCAYLISPIICLIFLEKLDNKPKRFLKGAFIPLPWLVIWIFSWHPKGYFDNFKVKYE